ncbi:MAG TPA: ABC transporter ATP-binding protein [Candidatus Saccharimonadales bacterium]|nr:ABC transporter ATP-binding protein [Candidatus Saccharimonadales bacterium]
MTPPDRSRESFGRIWRYFWPYVRLHRGLIAGSMVALFAEVALRLLEPWPLKFVFDRILHASSRRAVLSPAIGSADPMTLLALAALAVVAITGLRALAAYWQTIGFAKIGTRVLRKVRESLFRHVQYLSLSFHTSARTGDLVMRVINDVGLLQDVAVTAFLPLAAKSLVVAGMGALMFAMNWKLALMALSVLPLFWVRTVTLTGQITDVARKQRRQEGAMAATATESIGAIRTVQALSLEEKFAASFASESERNLKQDVKGKRLSAALERSVDVLIAMASALVLWLGARLVLRGEITAGDLLVFLAYLKSAYRPIQDFTKYTGRLAKASAAGERVIDLLERVPDVRDADHARRAPSFAGQIAFQGVRFAYEAHGDLLDDINLEIQPGHRVALVGPSGAGKSTLVSLLLRLYEPQAGRVLIDGQDIRQFTLESVRGQISVVLQDNLLFAGTVRDNIACAAPGAGDEEIEAAARLARAHDFITALPQGYHAIVGERGVTLSHGQRQRIAIARAAIRRAPILILDEPTTGLDGHNERAVIEALETVLRGRTTFLITHNLRQAARADLILHLQHGRIVERGTHAELLAAEGGYAALWRMRTSTEPRPSPAPAEAHP